MHLFFLNCFLLAFAFPTFSSGDEQLMVCKPVSSVFDTSRPNNSTINRQSCSSSTGKPGKQGARGLPGPPGVAGPPGVVDYDQVNSQLQAELDDIKKKLQCIDGVIVGNTCYKLIYRVGNSVTYERASSLCAFHGYGLAEIPTEEVYNAIYSYVKANWYILLDSQASTFIHIWLGSRYDGQGNVILTTGQRGYVRWYPNNPIAEARRTHMAMRVPIRPEDTTQGMFAIFPEYNGSLAPLCQLSLLV